jgi:hypothetical protein
MNDWPQWAKLVAGLGFPIVVAVALGGFVVHKLPLLDQTASAMEAHVWESHVQTALLRQICRNSAKSEMQAQYCEYGLPQWGAGR